MAELVQTLVELAFLAVNLLLVSIPLTAVVFAFSRLSNFFAKKFKLSWIKSVFLSTFVALFIAVLFVYAIPFLGVLGFVANDNLPSGITTQVVLQDNQLVEEQVFQIPFADSAFTLIVSFFRLAFIAAVLALLLLPVELLASAVFSKFEKKKSSNFLAFYFATFCAALILFAAILAFPWIAAGIAYFIFFS